MRHPFILVLAMICCVPSAAQQLDRRALDSILSVRPGLFDTLGVTDFDGSERDSGATHWLPPPAPIAEPLNLLGLQDTPFQVSYDRADGLRVGAILTLPAFVAHTSRLRGSLFAGYAFGSHYWQVRGELSREFLTPSSPLRIAVEGHVITDSRDASKLGSLENTVFAAIAGVDVRDEFQRRGATVSVQQFLDPRTWVAAEARYDVYRSSTLEAHWSLFGPPEPFAVVPTIDPGTIRSIALQGGMDYLTLRSFSGPRFGIEAEWEIGRWRRENQIRDTVRSFASLVVDARGSVAAVRNVLWLSAHVRFGAATSDAPLQRQFSLGGPGSLAGWPPNSLRGSRMLLISAEAMLQPLRTGALRSLRVILEDAVGATASPLPSSRDPFEGFPRQLRDFSNSLAIYLGTATGKIRVGVAWRTDRGASPVLTGRLAAR